MKNEEVLARIYSLLHPPITKEKMDEAYSLGLLKKEDLKDKVFYHGHCRNASIARWDESLKKFVYLRHKFGSSFEEDIVHPEDDEQFDIFVTTREVNWSVLVSDLDLLLKEASTKDAKQNARDFRDLANLFDSWINIQPFELNPGLDLMTRLSPFAYEGSQKRYVKILAPLLLTLQDQDQHRVASVLEVMTNSMDPEIAKSLLGLSKDSFPSTVPSPLASLLRKYS